MHKDSYTLKGASIGILLRSRNEKIVLEIVKTPKGFGMLMKNPQSTGNKPEKANWFLHQKPKIYSNLS